MNEAHAIQLYDLPVLWSTLEVFHDLQPRRYLVNGLDNERHAWRLSEDSDPREFTPTRSRYEFASPLRLEMFPTLQGGERTPQAADMLRYDPSQRRRDVWLHAPPLGGEAMGRVRVTAWVAALTLFAAGRHSRPSATE